MHHFLLQQLIDQKRKRMQMRESSCDKHEDKQVELFCHSCKKNICVLCFATKHKSHKNGEIPEVADNFILKINGDDKQILPLAQLVSSQNGYNRMQPSFVRKQKMRERKFLQLVI